MTHLFAPIAAGLLALFALLGTDVGPRPGALPAPHAEGEDYVFLDIQADHIKGRFEVNFVDLQTKLGLVVDRAEDRATADAKNVAPQVQRYLADNFRMQPVGGSPWQLQFTGVEVFVLPKRSYAQYHFRIDVEGLPDAIAIRHSLFYEGDRFHRGLLCVEYNAKTGTRYPEEYTALVFGPDKREQILDLNGIPGIYGPREMIPQGFARAWAGLDQTLFLLALLLSAVLRFRDSWQPVDGFKPALWNAAGTLIVFSAALSTALVLAAFDLVTLPPTLVHVVVAASILLAALHNFTGKGREGLLWVVLVLGLFHGFGLADAMGSLPFRMGALLRIVVGFGIGVELALLAVVLVALPLCFVLRRRPLYQPIVLRGVSALLAGFACWRIIQYGAGL